MLKLYVPVRVYNLTNARTHWRVRAQRMREQRDAVTYVLLAGEWGALPKPTEDTPWDVLLTRVAPSQGLDDDGLVSALKAVRDAVAAYVNVDDRHRHIVRYRYEQERGRDYGVRIEITARQLELKEACDAVAQEQDG